MAKQTPHSFILTTNPQPFASLNEMERVAALFTKTAGFVDACLVTLGKTSALDEDQLRQKHEIIGAKHSLLDAMVALSSIAIKCDEYRTRAALAHTLDDSDGIDADDREILRRYLETLHTPIHE